MKRLNKKQILMLHSELIKEFGGSEGVRDDNLLESAFRISRKRYRSYDYRYTGGADNGLWNYERLEIMK